MWPVCMCSMRDYHFSKFLDRPLAPSPNALERAVAAFNVLGIIQVVFCRHQELYTICPNLQVLELMCWESVVVAHGFARVIVIVCHVDGRVLAGGRSNGLVHWCVEMLVGEYR